MTAALRFEDLTLGYAGHPAVHHLTGEVPVGELLAVAGPNGAGKSTLLRAIIGELRPLAGRILRPQGDAGRIAYLAQQSELDRSFPISVFDLVAMGDWHRSGLLGGLGRAGRQRVGDALARVGLEGFEERAVGTLSRGQLQRALFARLVVQDAALILLDEPFTAVDERTERDLLAMLRAWHGEGRTVVAVLHDFTMVRERFPSVLLLAREPVAWGPPDTVLSADNLRRARNLGEAWDEHADRCAAELAA
jgi:zinc/manganese transport system ATP-binding protein